MVDFTICSMHSTVCFEWLSVFVYLWFALITCPPAWSIGNLPDEKLIINELRPNVVAISAIMLFHNIPEVEVLYG